MNKELIKKYKAEFDHWLNGGKLQVKFVNDPWEEAPKDIFSYSEVNFVLAINDEYVEFRKAMAEGKIIQCNAREDENDITYTAYGHAWWADTTEFKYATTFYRIKPEEPKFKVGDWFIHSSGIHQVKEVFGDSYRAEDGFDYMEDITPWQPKPGEWCLFYDQGNTKLMVLAKFRCTGIRYKFISESDTAWNYCIPFIGTLPDELKDT